MFLTDFPNVLLEKLAGYEIRLELIVSLMPALEKYLSVMFMNETKLELNV